MWTLLNRLSQNCGLVGFVLLLAAVAAAATGGNGPRQEKSTRQPKLLRVAKYTWGLSTGRITLDLTTSRVKVLRGGYGPGTVSWGSFEAQVSEKERNDLRRLTLQAGLRDFKPDPRWFGEYDAAKFGLREIGGDLVLTWDDKEVVVAVPPRQVRTRLPSKPKRVYEAMDLIVGRLWKVEEKYAEIASITVIEDPTESPVVKAFSKELDRVWEKSLPKDRKGW